MKKRRVLISIMSALTIATSSLIATSSSASAFSQAAFTKNKAKLTFSAKTVDGKSFNSKTLANKNPTVIWFWAPWCAICKNESAYITAAAQQYKNKVNFVGVGALGSRDELVEFVGLTGTSNFTNLDDSSGKLWNRFGVIIQPTLLFVDTKGNITTKVGPSDERFLAKRLAALTKKR
jgi:thiol-disulfide isomerase/thioredoxin